MPNNNLLIVGFCSMCLFLFIGIMVVMYNNGTFDDIINKSGTSSSDQPTGNSATGSDTSQEQQPEQEHTIPSYIPETGTPIDIYTGIGNQIIGVFDPNNYESCKPGERDDGLLCRKPCDPGDEENGALCYPKCRDGFYGVGPVCWSRCKDGWKDDGALCRKPIDTSLTTGRIPDKAACPPGMRDDGISCWADSYGRGTGWAKINGGIDRCERGEGTQCEEWGLYYYPKCKSGFHNVGCCVCEPDGGPGIRKTLFDRQYCRSDEDLIAGLCYPKCKPGYERLALNCQIIDSGKVVAKETYTRGAGYVPQTYAKTMK